VVPLARVEAMPPSEALAPGSTGNISPVARNASLSASRVTPGCTRATISACATSSTRFMRLKSTTTPPENACAWPSREVPVPQPTTGTRWRAQAATMRATSSVLSGQATASGGLSGKYDSLAPCRSRSDLERLSRWPRKEERSARAVCMSMG